jgi:uncharacterized cupredoxin-like copper-binding protein
MTHRARVTPVVVAVLLTVVAWAGGGTAAAAGASAAVAEPRLKPAPTHLLVYAQEWSLWPSRAKLPAGRVNVELWNRGQDMHDLRIRHVNAGGQMVGRVDGAVKVTPSGAITHATWHLQRGHYMIYCSMPGHFGRGMHARITVTSARG